MRPPFRKRLAALLAHAGGGHQNFGTFDPPDWDHLMLLAVQAWWFGVEALNDRTATTCRAFKEQLPCQPYGPRPPLPQCPVFLVFAELQGSTRPDNSETRNRGIGATTIKPQRRCRSLRYSAVNPAAGNHDTGAGRVAGADPAPHSMQGAAQHGGHIDGCRRIVRSKSPQFSSASRERHRSRNQWSWRNAVSRRSSNAIRSAWACGAIASRTSALAARAERKSYRRGAGTGAGPLPRQAAKRLGPMVERPGDQPRPPAGCEKFNEVKKIFRKSGVFPVPQTAAANELGANHRLQHAVVECGERIGAGDEFRSGQGRIGPRRCEGGADGLAGTGVVQVLIVRHQIDGSLFRCSNQDRQPVVGVAIIGIQNRNPVASGLRDRTIHGVGLATIFAQGDDPHPGVGRRDPCGFCRVTASLEPSSTIRTSSAATVWRSADSAARAKVVALLNTGITTVTRQVSAGIARTSRLPAGCGPEDGQISRGATRGRHRIRCQPTQCNERAWRRCLTGLVIGVAAT